MTTVKENKKDNSNRKIEVLIMIRTRSSFLLTIMGKYCVICNSTVKNYKVRNLRQHYGFNHLEFLNQYPPNSKLRSDQRISLKSNFNKQQSTLMTLSNQVNNVVLLLPEVLLVRNAYMERKSLLKNLERCNSSLRSK